MGRRSASPFPWLLPEIACIFRERALPSLAESPGQVGAGGLDSRKQIAATIRDHLARERMSREQFAFKTKLGKSTVDKLLIDLFSERTLTICTVVRLPPEPAPQG